ncbi:MAG: phosphoglycerate mutase (2,3-diphosphoglycerate-independent) [Candidatus Moranbacteria bacterium RIFOXYA12_FULL_35_19]|nr:MAG: 2,3-bisphosphoglycerate-independent phosphoglycerate mutase [Candidatus Moranbacteria bacterium GW2011_GWF2_35_39]OGI32374.1 MAG: phosphoglycerate mutase (2,3-diphosphoglycerate-independent) [Candidatus Moranbacteria bacterium RIFOXYC12_FULL_36_13]OGI33257.1 MAG: phosphoglycerate mutase (2,3-diphosphoglycerate-independent) [Candidatus Moranbacteria bacterium RIFOXYB12_FULL_35_8]OGI35351.1 MAG: phosphoglycerate mutase (2,3-diphosphoglycerate-independent) [Candidatus Moranbacteria bacteriu
MADQKSPTILVILDGYGVAPASKYNAITLAKKPTLDRLFELYPNTLLGATGQDVGLPDNKMSGSEAGHMNIGAGRIALQDNFYITKSIEEGTFFMNPALMGSIRHSKENAGNFHLMGMVGDNDSPHSDPAHFRAILKLAKNNGIKEVYCHLFTDGRDSYPKSALTHLKNFQCIMAEEKIGKIATLSGRFYAMDRSKNWDRLTKAYDAIVFSRGEKADSPEKAIEKAYESGLTDEYILPTVIQENNSPIERLKENDSLIFFNLRSDRARQFSKLFVASNRTAIINDDMPIIDHIKNLYFTALTDFGPDLNVHTVWDDQPLMGTLPMSLAKFKQLYIAETEKFAHVTYFLNGGYADPVSGENRIMVPSPKIDSYAKMPQMSAPKITKYLLEKMQKNKYDFYTVNFANADMVGHTGDLGATMKACEVLDQQIEILAKEVLKRGGNLIITADHGNAEKMFDEKANQAYTYHTKNPVPFLVVSEKFKNIKLKDGGILGNIAPTILDIMNIEKPKVMEKNSLIK